MYRRLFHHFSHIRSRSAPEPRYTSTDIILAGGAVGAVLVVFIVLIYFWWVGYWLQESPAPVTYIIDETMVKVADASLPTGGGGKIHWEVGRWYMLFTPEAARKMNARQFEGSTHGPVMIMCTRDSCERCDRMENETLSNPAITDRLNEKWVCIRVNANNRNGYVPFSVGMGLMSYRAFAVYFRVDSLPAFVFIDREGKPVQRVSGYWSADMFGPLLDYIQGEVYKRNIPFEQYRKELKR